MALEADFWKAITAGDCRTVESLLVGDPRLAAARRECASAILIATYHHKPDVVACLRSHLAELDLFEAAALGELDRVRLLLDSDARLANAVAEDGFGARARGHAALAEHLGEAPCS